MMGTGLNRRAFFSLLTICMSAVFLKPFFRVRQLFANESNMSKNNDSAADQLMIPEKDKRGQKYNLGCSKDGYSDVYLVRGGSPEKNMEKMLQMLGGIDKLIGNEDIVVLKPNAQWWNQGMTNTDAMRAFVEAILNKPDFRGEIIIAENQQYANPNSRGWTTEERNGRFNLNELVEYFQDAGYENVTKYHWQCAGPNPNPLQGDASSAARIVKGPGEGDGYVWRDDIIYTSPLGRKCMMTYPIFTSSFSGVTLDFKNGAWKNGEYIGNKVKFINFSALNHHSAYCGVTASIKNYMGIVDMTCGFQGVAPKGYWNTHYIGIRLDRSYSFVKYLPWRIKKEFNSFYRWKYFYHTGGALGIFMNKIRMADLNIITADWVGYASRTDVKLSGYPKTLLASMDPVALDYFASNQILAPLTKSKKTNDKWLVNVNDASNKNGPFYKFLQSCHEKGVGNIDPQKVRIHSS